MRVSGLRLRWLAPSKHTRLKLSASARQNRQRCKRPPRVIHRIRSKRGHLDNQTSLTCVAESATAKTQHVIFTHLSDECNDPALVEAMAKELLPAHLTVHVANQHEPVTARLKAAE